MKFNKKRFYFRLEPFGATLFDKKKETIYYTNHVGAEFCNNLLQGADLEIAISNLSKKFDKYNIKADCLDFLMELKKLGFVEVI